MNNPTVLDTDYAAFRDDWLQDVQVGNPSTVLLGNRFAQKLVAQWLDLDQDSDDIEYCDGANDGGIDVAVLVRPDTQEDADEPGGDTWYLVQSKYGSAFQGSNTIFSESAKIFETLNGQRDKLNSLSESLVQRLQQFRESMSERDRLVLVLATVDPLTPEQRQSLEHVRMLGNASLGAGFDIEAISIQTIHDRIIAPPTKVQVPLKGDPVASGEDIRVGTVGLIPLYDFLKRYQATTGDLDQIYEKNVRRFLGGRGRVNKTMKATLDDRPELFGLFNNGITVVVTDYHDADGQLVLTEPYIVNGCQTTKTVWEALRNRLEAGGTGSTSSSYKEWRARADHGAVVTKIVRVGDTGDELLRDITRYTNSQNAVREKDFLAITSDFRRWADEMASRYDVYLETQRGGWDSQRALQKQKPGTHQFTRHANAFDLLKVFGAAWLGEAGVAYGRNLAFLPNGTVFRRIINNAPGEHVFSVEDLYAAYLLNAEADRIGFGRGTVKQSRRQTRFLFYWATGRLLRDILVGMKGDDALAPSDVTQAVIRLWDSENETAKEALVTSALQLVDDYLTHGMDDVIYEEPGLAEMGSDVNRFLKWEKLGRDLDATPELKDALAMTKKLMTKASDAQAIRDALLTA